MSKWISAWYKISKERGHSDIVPFFYIRNNALTELSFHHQTTDAVGQMATFLNIVPQKKEKESLTIKQKLEYIWRGVATPYKTITPFWKSFNPTLTKKYETLAWLEFDVAATDALNLQSKNLSVSVKLFLMEKLSKIIFSELMSASSPGGSWLYPVNMRGLVPSQKIQENCVSYVPLTVTPNSTAKELHQEFKARMSQGEHWSNWFVSHIGKVVGLQGMRYLSKRASKKQFWLGSFSDLGDWSLEAPYNLIDGNFIFCPPGSPNYPISVGTQVFHGKRTLCLKIHPSIGEEGKMDLILEKLKNVLLEELNLPESTISKNLSTHNKT